MIPFFRLYAQWGVDYVKVDDIAFNALEGGRMIEDEIIMIHRAIDRCGRDMILSLSPGPAPIDKAGILCRHATMWRITADLWDRWEDMVEDMDRCAQWAPYVGQGSWPDADMLPLGHLSLVGSEHGVGERMTRLSRDEQITMMSLWCLFRSPMMFGGEMRDNDEFTLSLLTNRDVLSLLTECMVPGKCCATIILLSGRRRGRVAPMWAFLISPRFPVRWVFRFIGWGYRALSRFMICGNIETLACGKIVGRMNCGTRMPVTAPDAGRGRLKQQEQKRGSKERPGYETGLFLRQNTRKGGA